MKRLAPVLLISQFFINFLCISSASSQKITVAVAANFHYAAELMSREFKKTTGIEVELVTASSGKLTSQILNGAPYDLFISADLDYPMRIFSEGFAQQKPEVYALGKLVLISNQELDSTLTVSELLERIPGKIAIANPKLAPYGAAAEQLLQSFKNYTDLKSRLVFGESISNVNQFVISGTATIGFSSSSVLHVSSPEIKNLNFVEIDRKYAAIKQGVVILKHSIGKNESATKTFYNFLFSETGKKILVNNGYEIP